MDVTFSSFQMQVEGGEWQDLPYNPAGVPVFDIPPGEWTPAPVGSLLSIPTTLSISFVIKDGGRGYARLRKMLDQPKRKAAYQRRYRNGAK